MLMSIPSSFLTLAKVSKSYPNDVNALQGISVHIKAPEIIGIIGRNGSGKSTLLQLLAGHTKPTEGNITILGQPANRQATTFKQKTSYISQHMALDGDMTGRETLHLFTTLYKLPRHQRQTQLKHLQQAFDLFGFLDRPVKTYSGGQKQKLHLAIGMLHQPELMLLDEPTSALDQQARQQLWQYLHEAHNVGACVLIVSHDLQAVQRHCSRVWMLDKGRLIVDKSVTELDQKKFNSILHIYCYENMESCISLIFKLQQIEEIANVELLKHNVQIEFNRPLSAQQKNRHMQSVIEIFNEAKVLFKQAQWDEADLASMYQHLTGSPLDAGGNKKQGKGRGGGKRG